ncbi:hypothetical protein AAZV13_09G131500 [Glycine max]|nr:uncharacterized protein At4g15970 isoform X1 [Glycine max]XP_028179928.1 uncharacterized protein At4g15970-like isoform X1 [Glycine soja]KAG5013230.1 hypothetical protein JHK86_025491 [Glycine max]RZB92380.1 hypothetical protein D0Y65_024397 [Glycine soja]|eukprot:XP_003533457.2 uncharacterized protein At4g15970 isoform X1 [Glycine max]
MKDTTAGTAAGDGIKPWSSGGSHLWARRAMQLTMFLVGFAVLWMFLYNTASPFGFPGFSHYYIDESAKVGYDPKLASVLRNACMKDKTVIITTLNDAWAEPGSIFDLFLESFRLGNQTKKFLNHLVVITWDQKAHARCLALHKHCYQVETKGDNFTGEAFFMTADYLHMMWRRIEFLGTVLDMGYNFVFTDTDIMWLRDPFKQFYKDTDFQIACDFFNGNSYDLNNHPNGGFNYVKSNKRTILFYKFWFNSRNAYPKLHDQDVLNKIKKDSFVSNMKLKVRFLSTSYFGGFCQHAEDFNKVSTMHANCCVGLENKVNDLKILLEDWKKYVALPESKKNQSHPSWSVSCRTSFERAKQKKQKNKGRLRRALVVTV